MGAGGWRFKEAETWALRCEPAQRIHEVPWFSLRMSMRFYKPIPGSLSPVLFPDFFRVSVAHAGHGLGTVLLPGPSEC